MPTDFLSVTCDASDGKSYTGLHMGVVAPPPGLAKKQANSPDLPNILILIQDSISR